MSPYLSSKNHIKLTFRTNSFNESRGFNATVQFVKTRQCDNNGRCVLQCPPSFLPCNGYCVLDTVGCHQQCLVFNQTTMTLTRQISGNVYLMQSLDLSYIPIISDDYWPYEDCHTTIHSQFKNESVLLSFHHSDSFDPVGSDDSDWWASFYDGENVSPPLLEKITSFKNTKYVLSSGHHD